MVTEVRAFVLPLGDNGFLAMLIAPNPTLSALITHNLAKMCDALRLWMKRAFV